MSDKDKVYDEDGKELTPADYDRWDGRTCIKWDSPPNQEQGAEKEPKRRRKEDEQATNR